MNQDELEKDNSIKLRIYRKLNLPVHIKKKDGTFYNGHIKEISRHYFIIEDFKIGRQLVFIMDLCQEVTKYRTLLL